MLNEEGIKWIQQRPDSVKALMRQFPPGAYVKVTDEAPMCDSHREKVKRELQVCGYTETGEVRVIPSDNTESLATASFLVPVEFLEFVKCEEVTIEDVVAAIDSTPPGTQPAAPDQVGPLVGGITIVMDENNDGSEFDEAIKGTLPECGDLKFVVKNNGTKKGKPVVLIGFTSVLLDGNDQVQQEFRVQSVVTVRNLIMVLRILETAFPGMNEEGMGVAYTLSSPAAVDTPSVAE
jgi:hypothetical protein